MCVCVCVCVCVCFRAAGCERLYSGSNEHLETTNHDHINKRTSALRQERPEREERRTNERERGSVCVCVCVCVCVLMGEEKEEEKQKGGQAWTKKRKKKKKSREDDRGERWTKGRVKVRKERRKKRRECVGEEKGRDEMWDVNKEEEEEDGRWAEQRKVRRGVDDQGEDRQRGGMKCDEYKLRELKEKEKQKLWTKNSSSSRSRRSLPPRNLARFQLLQ